MPSIIDELTEGDEAKRQEILEALKEMAKALTLPIEQHSGIGPENIMGIHGDVGAYWFSLAAVACFGKYRGSDPEVVQVHPMINKAIEKVDQLIEAFAATRDEKARKRIRFFFYSDLGNIMLGKARKYSPALWTTLEPGLLQELVDWV